MSIRREGPGDRNPGFAFKDAKGEACGDLEMLFRALSRRVCAGRPVGRDVVAALCRQDARWGEAVLAAVASGVAPDRQGPPDRQGYSTTGDWVWMVPVRWEACGDNLSAFSNSAANRQFGTCLGAYRWFVNRYWDSPESDRLRLTSGELRDQ